MIEACLRRLLRFYAKDEIALTGGLAIEYHLAAAGLQPLRARVADLDFVARNVTPASSGIADEFLVSHYHAPDVTKAMLQLVDPETALRIDVFPDLDGVVASASFATLQGVELRVVDPRSILDHKLRTIRGATRPIDPKHRRDVAALAAICGTTIDLPIIPEAIESYSQDVDAVCRRCLLSETPALPLAPKREIFAILGYV